MTNGAPAPGWYPDPEDESRLRYWDGAAWTDRTAGREAIAQGPAAGSGSAQGPWWRRPITIAGALALVVVVAAVAVFTLSGEAEAEVILEPTAATGTDPFTESVASEEVAELAADGLAGDPVEGASADGDGIATLTGATPGLYGGTGSEAACDPAALTSFLEENPDKAEAFAGVLGIAPSEVDDYIAGLTPVLLREDTRVTNHGFTEGRANPFEAVLQAGSAVMVDERGVPRVRCACGNPLAEPTGASSADYSGERWEGFDQDRLVAVAAADQELESFEVVNVTTGERYEQGVGGGAGTETKEKHLMTARIPELCDQGSVRLEDGAYDGPEGFALINGLMSDVGGGIDLQLGDLTGDGVAEGMIVIYQTCEGGLRKARSLVYSGRELLAEPPLSETVAEVNGDPGTPRMSIYDTGIVDGDAVIEVVAVPPGACSSCYENELTVRYRWNGDDFDVSTSPGVGALSEAGEGAASEAPEGVSDDRDVSP